LEYIKFKKNLKNYIYKLLYLNKSLKSKNKKNYLELKNNKFMIYRIKKNIILVEYLKIINDFEKSN
jgi:hypothetical protein